MHQDDKTKQKKDTKNLVIILELQKKEQEKFINDRAHAKAEH